MTATTTSTSSTTPGAAAGPATSAGAPGATGTTRGTRRRHPSATRRLVTSELRLLLREPTSVLFVLVFPIVSMLIIGGAFGTEPDDVFPVNPSHWYVASYFAVVMGGTGLIMLPVRIASYRERGVLRRFAAAGFPRWSFALAQLTLGLVAVVVSGAALLAVATPVYGIPAVDDPVRVVVAVAAGSVLFIAIGVLLGTLLRSARAAQAVGMLLFFPSFLLGGGGPPPAVMTPALESVAGVLPMTLVVDQVRGPWLGLETSTTGLVVLVGLAVVAGVVALRRARL